MAQTIDDGFKKFLGWLTPTTTESENAKRHRASIEACLKDKFGMLSFFRIGSFGNGTSVSCYSDVDYMASIPAKNLKRDSGLTLNELKGVLVNRFPNTGVHIDSPAVVMPFGDAQSETTEIVPGHFIKKESVDCRTYDIPDGSGGWMRVNPELHIRYVNSVNNKEGLDKKVKSLIRFVKAWKFYNNVKVSSFYLEMFVAKYASTESAIFYSIDLKSIFEKLLSSGLSPIQDPMRVSGYINACKNSTDHSNALLALEKAVSRSKNARLNEDKDDIERAFYWWNLLFNEGFPSY